MKEIGAAIISVLLAIIGVAIIAVIVGGNSQTATVLKSGGKFFSGLLNSAFAIPGSVNL